MTFLEWILNKLRNNEEISDADLEQIPLRIETDAPIRPPEPSDKKEKEDNRVIIIDI